MKHSDQADIRKLNAPPRNQPFAWQTVEMLDSFAWRALSGSAKDVIDRIQVEHGRHFGRDNGQLPVTYRDFEEHGIGGSSILPALAEACALGFIERTSAGKALFGPFKGTAARYRLCWLPTQNSPAKNGWQRFRSLDDARACARAARAEIKNQKSAANGARNSPAHLILATRKKAAK